MINALHLLWIIPAIVIPSVWIIFAIYKRKYVKKHTETRFITVHRTEKELVPISAYTITDKSICLDAKENDNLRSMIRDHLMCALIDNIADYVSVTAKEDFNFQTGRESVMLTARIRVCDEQKKSFDEILDNLVPSRQ